MTDNSRFPKLRIHQVFEIHLFRRKAAQAEDKVPFFIYVGTVSIGEGLAKRGTLCYFQMRGQGGGRGIFSEFWKDYIQSTRVTHFCFHKRGL